MLHQRRNIDSFVLLYGVTGQVFLSDDGREYTLSPEDYLILGADREHVGTRRSDTGVSYYWCHFYLRGDYAFRTDREGREWLVLPGEEPAELPMYGRFPAPARMHLLFHQLMDSSRTPSPFSRGICQNFLEIILGEIGAAALEEQCTSSQEAAAANILEWIGLNAPQIHHVGDVAAHFGYNSEYLTTMVKKATGQPLVYHINQSRIELAKRLLCSTKESIQSIAEQCGFADEKYFSRVFRKHCDISPGRFRKAYGKQHLVT